MPGCVANRPNDGELRENLAIEKVGREGVPQRSRPSPRRNRGSGEQLFRVLPMALGLLHGRQAGDRSRASPSVVSARPSFSLIGFQKGSVQGMRKRS
jgi:hypothetical protein